MNLVLLRKSRWLASLVVVTVSLTSTSCTDAWAKPTLAAIQAALQNLKDTRELMESFARDVKKSRQPTDEGYKVAAAKYAAARSAFNGYATALRMAALDDGERGDLRVAAQNVQEVGEDFLRHVAQELDPTLSLRSIPVAHAIQLPVAVPKEVRQIRRELRPEAVEDFMRQIEWLAWNDI